MNSPFSNLGTSASEQDGIVRDFGDYSLRFPCDPRVLEPVRRGMGLLIWSDLILTAAFLLLIAVLTLTFGRSEKFADFVRSMTEERLAHLQTLAPEELYLELKDELPIEEAVQPVGLVMLIMLTGTILNMVGTSWCAKVPGNILPGAWGAGFVWYGALVLGMLISFLLPLLLLLAWQKWLQNLLRLSWFLGEPEALKHLRTVHRSVFYAILLFLAVTLVPWVLKDPANSMTVISGLQWVLAACLLFAVFTYIQLLRSLRANIARMNRLWLNGSEEYLEK